MTPGFIRLSHRQGLIINDQVRTIRTKKMLHVNFTKSSRPGVHISCLTGHTVTGSICDFLKRFKVAQVYTLIRVKAASHQCNNLKAHLATENEHVVNHPPYSPGRSPCDFFSFPKLKCAFWREKSTRKFSRRCHIHVFTTDTTFYIIKTG